MNGVRRLYAAILAFSFIMSFPLAYAADAKPTLYVLTWEKYFSQEIIDAVENKLGCEIELDHYDSSDAFYEKVKHGARGYDLLLAASGTTFKLIRSGVIQELNHEKIPNVKYVSSHILAKFPDPEMRYHMPYIFSVSGIAYRRSRIPENALGNWHVFETDGIGKNAAMSNEVRLILGAALKHLGYSVNTTDPEEIIEAATELMNWKKSIALFSAGEAEDLFVRGELSLIQTFNGKALEMMRQDPDIGFYVPEEGSIFRSDSFLIPTCSANTELAHAFINALMEPALAAAIMEEKCFYMFFPEARELIPPTISSHPVFRIPLRILEKSEYIADVGTILTFYDEAIMAIFLGRDVEGLSTGNTAEY